MDKQGHVAFGLLTMIPHFYLLCQRLYVGFKTLIAAYYMDIGLRPYIYGLTTRLAPGFYVLVVIWDSFLCFVTSAIQIVIVIDQPS